MLQELHSGGARRPDEGTEGQREAAVKEDGRRGGFKSSAERSDPAGRAEGQGGDLLTRSRRDGLQQGLALVRPLGADDGVGAFRESRTEATEQQGQEEQLEFTIDFVPVISKL